MRDSANGKEYKSLGTPRSVVRARDGAARNQHDSGRRKRSSASTRAFCSIVPSKAGFRFVGHDRQTTRLLQPARQFAAELRSPETLKCADRILSGKPRDHLVLESHRKRLAHVVVASSPSGLKYKRRDNYAGAGGRYEPLPMSHVRTGSMWRRESFVLLYVQ